MFSQSKITRLFGLIIAACPFGVGRADAKTYVLAENSCVTYNDNNESTADCQLYSFESCASNCIEAPTFYQITGSTDARDFQRNCINTTNIGAGSYTDEWGSEFNGRDNAGTYTMNVSGCLLDSPLVTGRYGVDSCGTGEDECSNRIWGDFRNCVNNIGCLLADQYTGIVEGVGECTMPLKPQFCNFTTGIVCPQYVDYDCTPYAQDRYGCTPASPVYRTADEAFQQLMETCGGIEIGGTTLSNMGFTRFSTCGTGYVLF